MNTSKDWRTAPNEVAQEQYLRFAHHDLCLLDHLIKSNAMKAYVQIQKSIEILY